ncbi:unnamed protein product, partial [Prorocentrum cordatum]
RPAARSGVGSPRQAADPGRGSSWQSFWVGRQRAPPRGSQDRRAHRPPCRRHRRREAAAFPPLRGHREHGRTDDAEGGPRCRAVRPGDFPGAPAVGFRSCGRAGADRDEREGPGKARGRICCTAAEGSGPPGTCSPAVRCRRRRSCRGRCSRTATGSLVGLGRFRPWQPPIAPRLASSSVSVPTAIFREASLLRALCVRQRDAGILTASCGFGRSSRHASSGLR